MSPVVINDSSCNNALVETVWVRITLHGKHALIGSVYHPPSFSNDYWSIILKQVEYVLSLNKIVIILGNFNLYFNSDDSLCDKSLTQLRTDPNRITTCTQSIIDLIFTTVPNIHSESGVIPISLSEHFLVYTILDFKIPKPGIKFLYQQNYKNFYPDKFFQEIGLSTNISCIFYIDNVDTAWQTFYCEFLRICNKHAPLYKHLIKDRHNLWITNKVKILA